MTSGSENGKIPGGHAKLTEISGSLKFHIHSLRMMRGKQDLLLIAGLQSTAVTALRSALPIPGNHPVAHCLLPCPRGSFYHSEQIIISPLLSFYNSPQCPLSMMS